MVRKALVFRFIFLVLLSLLASCSSSEKELPPRPDNWQVPYTRVTLLDGEYLPLTSYLNRPTAVMFWASWCSSSRSTIDDYAEVAAKYRNMNFLAVSLDSSTGEQGLRDFIAKNNLSGLIHSYSGNKFQDEAALSFRVEKIPYFYLINTKEQVVYEGNDLDDLEEGVTRLNEFRGSFRSGQ